MVVFCHYCAMRNVMRELTQAGICANTPKLKSMGVYR